MPTKAANNSKAASALKIRNQGTGVDTRRRRRSFVHEHGRESGEVEILDLVITEGERHSVLRGGEYIYGLHHSESQNHLHEELPWRYQHRHLGVLQNSPAVPPTNPNVQEITQ